MPNIGQDMTRRASFVDKLLFKEEAVETNAENSQNE
jgi:hypothetical protein